MRGNVERKRPWALRGPRGERGEGLRLERPTALLGAPTAAHLYLYDEIGFWGIPAADVVAALAEAGPGPVVVHVNSPGGDVWDGIAIYNTLRQHPGDVTVMVDGLCASAASFIAQAGNRVVTARNAQWMIHDAQGVAIGDAATMTRTAELLTACSANIADIYAQRSGRPVAEWQGAMRAETWYSGREAVEAGLADEMDPAEEVDDETMPEGGVGTARATASTDVRPRASVLLVGEQEAAPDQQHAHDPPDDGDDSGSDAADGAAEGVADATPVTTDTATPSASWLDSLFTPEPSWLDDLFTTTTQEGAGR